MLVGFASRNRNCSTGAELPAEPGAAVGTTLGCIRSQEKSEGFQTCGTAIGKARAQEITALNRLPAFLGALSITNVSITSVRSIRYFENRRFQ